LGKEAAMIRVPRDFKPLLDNLSASFRRPQTARRFILFFAAAVIVTGDRTVSAVLRLIALLQPVNPSTFHRLFSHRRWSSDTLAKIIVAFILERFVPKDVVKVVGDETVDGHRGKKVYGKARHRDASDSILLPLAPAPHPVPLSPQRLPAKDLLKRCAVRGKLAGRGAE
jgi:hypothetical protein